VLPFICTAWLWKRRTRGGRDWALTAAPVAAFALLAFLAAPWAMVSYYLRFLLVLFLALALYFSFKKSNGTPERQSYTIGEKIISLVKVIALVFLLLLDAFVIKGYFFPISSVELAFPLSGGDYYVIPNPFHRDGSYPSQEWYALDIVKLNRMGSRAIGIYPMELTAYAIYGDTVYSPCDGEIIEAIDEVQDNPIGDAGKHPSNHLVIRCQGLRVTLAHLMRGSLLLQNGQSVREGQPLGKVGNSGHASEPHLHIDVVRDSDGSSSEPVAISFGGRVLSWNSVIRR
nr:M23 family metallopeptidase [Acidobacteriota bacterium]